jgi:hypothetical protein
VVVRTERVEVPVVRERVVTRTPRQTPIFGGLQPVKELRPRIIRSVHHEE